MGDGCFFFFLSPRLAHRVIVGNTNKKQRWLGVKQRRRMYGIGPKKINVRFKGVTYKVIFSMFAFPWQHIELSSPWPAFVEEFLETSLEGKAP